MKPGNRILILFSTVLLLLPGTLAAVLHGTLYDAELELVKGAVVEVDTIPLQRVAAPEGTYTFAIRPGNYTITAMVTRKGETLQDKEMIMVQDEGDYTLDLFLFPFSTAGLNESTDLEGLDDDLAALAAYQEEKQTSRYRFPFTAAVILLVVSSLYLFSKRNKRSVQGTVPTTVSPGEALPDDTLSSILQLVREAGGRMTQKDLRQKLPYSEAKISLAIAELEHQGKLQKIKKGRGNILIVK